MDIKFGSKEEVIKTLRIAVGNNSMMDTWFIEDWAKKFEHKSIPARQVAATMITDVEAASIHDWAKGVARGFFVHIIRSLTLNPLARKEACNFFKDARM